MVEAAFWLFALAVALAYVYAYVGRFADAANAIATICRFPSAFTPCSGCCRGCLQFNLIGGLTGRPSRPVVMTGAHSILSRANRRYPKNAPAEANGLIAPRSKRLMTVFLALENGSCGN
jgi:hypothetical protein